MFKKKGENKKLKNDIVVYLRELNWYYTTFSRNVAFYYVSYIGWNEEPFICLKTTITTT